MIVWPPMSSSSPQPGWLTARRSASASCAADAAGCRSLREMTQHVETGPIPLAAAHAAEGLQQLLSVSADSQNVTPADVDRLAGPVTDELRAARESLVNAIGNIDILLNLLDAIA